MTNLRMQQSLLSDVSLYNMFKKLTNEQWRQRDDKWEDATWHNITGSKIDLVNGRKFGLHYDESGKLEINTKIDFMEDILQRKKLIYGKQGEYWQINDFGYEKFPDLGQPIYYTEEDILNADGSIRVRNVKIYHIFDKDSNHIQTTEITPDLIKDLQNFKTTGVHTINSLFELHSALGGVFCVEQKNKEFIPSEFNNQCIARYMNLVGSTADGRKHLSNKKNINNGRYEDILTQEEYSQPLKYLMISMAGNVTSDKSEQTMVNPKESWTDDSELTT